MPLTLAEEDDVWERFCAAFAFRPSVYLKDFPGIREPSPSATYALPREPGGAPDDGVDGRLLPEQADLDDLEASMLAAFRSCIPSGGRIYALDWQHQCYWLYPHARGGSPLEIYPSGDYHIFLAEDLRWGLFGHPWEWTICVFGADLLSAVQAHAPRLFTAPLRSR